MPLTEVERLALLAETTTRLTSTLDADEAVRRLTDLLLPRLADWVVVDLIVERDEVWRKAVVRADGTVLKHRTDLEGPMPPIPEESPMPLSRALRGVTSTLAGPENYRGAPDSGIAVEQRRLFEATGIHSAAIVPLRGARDVLGALTLGRSTTPGNYTDSDIPLFEDIGRRAALALDNARLYQRQRAVAETMQKYLLPQMPQVQGLEMTVRYLPAPDASQVGGDWYDAFTLPDGAIAVAIGDVVGHDLEAAAGMAQMRNILRAYAWSQQRPASRVVAHLDEAIQPLTDVTMATLVFARLAQITDNTWELTWTNAGHPRRCWSLGTAWLTTSPTDTASCWALACGSTRPGPTPSQSSRRVPPWSSTPTVSSRLRAAPSTTGWSVFGSTPQRSRTARSRRSPTNCCTAPARRATTMSLSSPYAPPAEPAAGDDRTAVVDDADRRTPHVRTEAGTAADRAHCRGELRSPGCPCRQPAARRSGRRTPPGGGRAIPLPSRLPLVPRRGRRARPGGARRQRSRPTRQHAGSGRRLLCYTGSAGTGGAAANAASG
ncbi:GAF domain-containing protein [Streptomyces sp. DconLS]|nr:GAF domain-containing protein [Streptomyces sp. DconLS]